MTDQVMLMAKTAAGMGIIFGFGVLVGRMSAKVKEVHMQTTKVVRCDGSCVRKITPVDEREMMRVAGTSEDDPFFRVPLHIAGALRAAKEEEVGEMLERATPADAAGLDKAAWMASGYVKACAEFQRVWIGLRRKGEEKREKEMER